MLLFVTSPFPSVCFCFPFQTCTTKGDLGGTRCRGVISDFLGCNLQGELRKVLFTDCKAHSPGLWSSSPPCASGICSAVLQKEFHGGVVMFDSATWDPHHITQSSHCPKFLTSAHLSVRGPVLIWGEHCLSPVQLRNKECVALERGMEEFALEDSQQELNSGHAGGADVQDVSQTAEQCRGCNCTA